MATKIAVLSDTHGLLRPEVLDRIVGCDAIIHGGDINKPEIIDRLNEIAPVYVVRGNNDKEWAENIPESFSLEVFYNIADALEIDPATLLSAPAQFDNLLKQNT